MGDVLIPADYDGDGQTDLAEWRSLNGRLYRAQSTAGVDGVNWARPLMSLVGRITTATAKRTSRSSARYRNGCIVGTTIGQFVVQQFGQDGEVPTPSAFIYKLRMLVRSEDSK